MLIRLSLSRLVLSRRSRERSCVKLRVHSLPRHCTADMRRSWEEGIREGFRSGPEPFSPPTDRERSRESWTRTTTALSPTAVFLPPRTCSEAGADSQQPLVQAVRQLSK